MFTKSQAFGLLAAVITIAPSAAIAQEAPNPENQQTQVSEAQTTVNNQVSPAPTPAPAVRKRKSSFLPKVGNAVLQGVTGGKSVVPGVAGAVIKQIFTKKKNNPAPSVDNTVNSFNNQPQDNTPVDNVPQAENNTPPVDNVPQAQQPSNSSVPTTHLCNAQVGLDMSMQNLNPLNVASGVVGVARDILGGKNESPNKLKANGGMGCFPRQ